MSRFRRPASEFESSTVTKLLKIGETLEEASRRHSLLNTDDVTATLSRNSEQLFKSIFRQ